MARKEETPRAVTSGVSRKSSVGTSKNSNSRSHDREQSKFRPQSLKQANQPKEPEDVESQKTHFIGAPVWELERRNYRLCAGEREYRGSNFFDVRRWVGESGEQPTKEGVTIPLSEVAGLARAMLAYAEERLGSGSDDNASN